MAGNEYVPKFLDASEVTFTAAAAVTAGQLVQVTGAYEVTPGSAAADAQFGVAAMTVASGAVLPVYFEGVHTLASGGAIPAGSGVVAGASGAVVVAPSGVTPGEIVGYALTTGAASGTVDVRLSY